MIDYFNDVIKCILPASIVVLVFSITRVFAEDAGVYLIMIYVPTIVDSILIYEASVLQVDRENVSGKSGISQTASGSQYNRDSVASKETRSRLRATSISPPESPTEIITSVNV